MANTPGPALTMDHWAGCVPGSLLPGGFVFALRDALADCGAPVALDGPSPDADGFAC